MTSTTSHEAKTRGGRRASANHRRSRAGASQVLEREPLWYKDAIIYELHVRAFCDSDGDGIGDFNGLITKLDYLQDLGVTAIWLLPFYPSPLKDDGYDIADYTDVHPSYGTLSDVKRFLAEAHERGLRVITELAINHTSTDHAWFQRARRAAPGSRHRGFYVWSDSVDRYSQARIIFEDFETSNWTFDPVAGAHYWHRFYSHQPDLNFDSPDVQKAVIKVMDFWLGLGVDGMRLDAVPYLYEREGTNCENLPETHAFLKRLRAHVDAHYEDRMLLAEANQWPEDAAAYFGDGDECHMNFHFPVMPRLFMSVQLESRRPIVDILEQTPEIPESCQWALFLRNHDELTLEMVTDEDRDYMYRSYAEDPRMRVNVGIRRRLSPLLKLRSKIELMNGLLMSLPGTPVLYYGDEIGQGDNVYLGDRNGVRTPMQWSGDRNAGFSRANPQKLYLPVIIDPEYHYEAVNVEVHQSNPESLLWWMKRVIALRKQYPVFGRGTTSFIDADNQKVLCFIRSHEGRHMLVAANLSRHAQYAELDLSEYEGMVPVEVSGGTPFPQIGELPYLITLNGYGFVWLELTPGSQGSGTYPPPADLPRVERGTEFRELFRGRIPKALEQATLAYVRNRRWFRGKARKVKGIKCLDQLPLGSGGQMALAVLRIEYASELPEIYVLPVAFAGPTEEARILKEHPEAVIARLRLPDRKDKTVPVNGLLYEPTHDDALGNALLSLFSRRRILSAHGTLASSPERELRHRLAGGDVPGAWVAAGEQSNTTIFFGHELTLKIFRQIEAGLNPDAEISQHLTARGFANTAAVLGTLQYDGPDMRGATVGMVQRFVPNVGNAWDVTLDWLRRGFEHALSLAYDDVVPELPAGGMLAMRDQPLPDAVAEVVGGYQHLVRLLGTRTAELHLALAEDAESAAFRPEPFAGHYQRSILQAARDRLGSSLQLLRKQLDRLPEDLRPLASQVLSERQALGKQLTAAGGFKVEASRIRCHGDLHLGQVLYDERDFTFIDFEGEPAVSIGVRRLKRSALYDVCGMLRSFHYAATLTLMGEHFRPEDQTTLRPWAQAWYAWICAAYLDAYLVRAGDAAFVPQANEGIESLINIHLIEKCAYELAYELNNRPRWVEVPLSGLHALIPLRE